MPRAKSRSVTNSDRRAVAVAMKSWRILVDNGLATESEADLAEHFLIQALGNWRRCRASRVPEERRQAARAAYEYAKRVIRLASRADRYLDKYRAPKKAWVVLDRALKPILSEAFQRDVSGES